MSILANYKVITITHHNLNVDELGSFVVKYLDEDDLREKLHGIKEAANIREMIYLSTCNRITFVLFTYEDIDAPFLERFFQLVNPKLSQDSIKRIHKFTDIYGGYDAIEHIFQVASSMDSLVVGEREIFRQFREAYKSSQAMGLTGDNMRLLERYTVETGKKVYDQTRIGEKPLSIVSLAMQAMRRHDLDTDARIIMVGAGETNTLVGKFLKKYGFKHISIFNRSLDNAAKLSKALDAKSYHLSELGEYKGGFDVMIVTTGATDPIITTPIYKNLIGQEEDQKIVIDLSVPANVCSELVTSFNMDYIDIEKLRAISLINLESRKKEIHEASIIVRQQLQEFHKIFQRRQIEIAMRSVPQEIAKVKHNAIGKVYRKKLEGLDNDTLSLIHEMMDYMEKKCISVPIKAAKSLVN